MITYQSGNIFHDQADAIINPVNTVSVMGKGLALQLELKSVAIPALGSGSGGLPWAEVEQLMQLSLAEMSEVEWRFYAPQG